MMKPIARFTALLVAAGCTVFLLSCSAPDNARAVATRVSAQSQLIGGVRALGTLGDYLLENDQIRVIIHGPGPNRGATFFGGSIIDADLVRPGSRGGEGRDGLAEISPSFLLEGLNPDSFQVLADGKDGGAAVIRVEGSGGDMLGMASVLNTALLFSSNLRFRVDYKLSPGDPFVEIETTLINTAAASHPIPFVDPPSLVDFGLDIPGLDELELSVPMGQLLMF